MHDIEKNGVLSFQEFRDVFFSQESSETPFYESPRQAKDVAKVHAAEV